MSAAQIRGRNNKARGKAIERTVAALVGGQRVPDSGGMAADVETEKVVYEVKSRQSPPWALWQRAWGQARHAAEKTGKEPRLVLSFIEKQKRTYYEIRRLG